MPIAFLTSVIAIPISLNLEGGDEGGDEGGAEGGDVNSNGDCIDECGPINPAVLSKSFLVIPTWNEPNPSPKSEFLLKRSAFSSKNAFYPKNS